MPWMRIAIGMGGAAMVAGIAGIVVWINDGTRAFDVALAVASAGLLTLVSCVLARIFGSSHGSQDDAFERGRSMGYDAGFLEGHRTARPVVVPLRDTDHAGGFDIPPATMPLWGRDAMPPARSHARPHSPRALRERLVAWAGDKRAPLQQRAGDKRTLVKQPAGEKRTRMLQWAEDRQNPILAGALCLALVGVLVAGLAVRMPAAVDALAGPSGSLFHRAVSPPGQDPALEDESATSPPRATAGGGSPLAPAAPDATGEPGALGGSGGSGGVGESGTSAAGAGGVAGQADTAAASGLPNLPGGGAVVPAIIHVPAPAGSATTPPVVASPPVVAAPAVPLTAAQQTAADAAAAAALTAANASAAAALTAANAKSAAELTAATAAAAAAATAQAAADAAWAVAHPQP